MITSCKARYNAQTRARERERKRERELTASGVVRSGYEVCFALAVALSTVTTLPVVQTLIVVPTTLPDDFH